MNITKFWLRTLGILGLLGGLTLFAGDMLFYYNGSNTDLLHNMSISTDAKIIGSGVTALVGSWLYLLGLGQVYYAFKSASALARNIVFISFGAILMSYGVIHGTFVAIATSAKLAVQHNLDLEATVELASKANDALRILIYPIFALLSVVFIYQVWKKNTLYPRWILMFFPLVLFILQGLFDMLFTGKAWVIFMGGYLNLMLFVFFTASTIALWRKP